MVPSEALTPPPRVPPFCLAGGEPGALGEGSSRRLTWPRRRAGSSGAGGGRFPRKGRGAMYIKQVRPMRPSRLSRAREDRSLRQGFHCVTRGLSPPRSGGPGAGGAGGCGRPRPVSTESAENCGAPLQPGLPAGRWPEGGCSLERCRGPRRAFGREGPGGPGPLVTQRGWQRRAAALSCGHGPARAFAWAVWRGGVPGLGAQAGVSA